MKASSILLLFALGSPLANAAPYGAPYFSVGDLTPDNASGSTVRGPELSWKIQHPSATDDLVSHNATTGTLQTLVDLRLTMHVVGVGPQTKASRARVGFWSVLNGGSAELLFDGTPLTQSAKDAVFSRNIPAHTNLLLAGRAFDNLHSTWLEARTSTGGDQSVRAFRLGDAAPTAITQAPKGFIASYLSEPSGSPATQTFALGPTQMLFCFELNNPFEGESNYDLQDLVVLVTFETL